MGSTFTAHASVELFANPSHKVAISYFTTNFPIPFEPHFVYGFNGDNFPRDGDPLDAIEDFALANGEGLYFVHVFAGNAVAHPPRRSSSICESGPSMAGLPKAMTSA
jgi:hypothetical protein